MTQAVRSLLIAGATNPAVARSLDAQMMVNAYCLKDNTGKVPLALRKMPGYRRLCTLDTSSPQASIRLLYTVKNLPHALFCVAGNQLYQLDSHLTPSLLTVDGMNTAQGFVSATSNGRYVLFVDGEGGYAYDAQTGQLVNIKDTGFPGKPLMCAILDGFFVIVNGESNQVYASRVNDPTTGYSYALATARPGLLIGCAVLNQRLFLFKTDSIEVWWDKGTNPFPFARDNSALFDVGCWSAASIAVHQGRLFFLGGTADGVGAVMMSDGGEPVAISTDAINTQLQRLTAPADCRGLVYDVAGHVFYQLNFTQDNVSLCYDATLDRWSTLRQRQGQRHVADTAAYFQQQLLIGAYDAPVLFELSPHYYDFDGDTLVCERILPPICHPARYRLRLNDVIAGAEVGHGLDTELTPTDLAPTLYLNLSTDGGYTYGNAQPASLGRVGQRWVQPTWRRLGVAEEWVLKLQVFDAIPVTLYQLTLHYEVMRR